LDLDSLQTKVANLNSLCLRLAEFSNSRSELSQINWNTVSSSCGYGQFELCEKFLTSQRERFLQIAHKAREASLELQDLSSRNAEECSEIESKIEQFKKETKRLDEKHKEDSEKLALELNQIAKETEFAKQSLDAANRAGLCVDEEAEVQSLKRSIEMQATKYTQDAQEYDDSVHKALALMVDFKEEVELIVKKVLQTVSEITRESGLVTRDHQNTLKRL